MPTTGVNAHPGERPPVMPITATQHTAAGARAFAEFFIRTIDWAYATTSTTYMRHYFTSDCVECRSIAEAVDENRRKQYHVIGGRFNGLESAAPSRQGANWSTILRFDVSAAEVVTSKDQYVDAEGALSNYRERVTLKWGAAWWRVVDIFPVT